MNEDIQSSHVERGVITAEAGVFCCMFWNIEFWILDVEASLDKSLGDAEQGEEEQLEMWSHGEDHNPCWFLYSLSTAKALPRFDSNS